MPAARRTLHRPRALRRAGTALVAGAAVLALLPAGSSVARQHVAAGPAEVPREALSCTQVSSGRLCLLITETGHRGTIKVTYQRDADRASRPGSLLYQRVAPADTGAQSSPTAANTGNAENSENSQNTADSQNAADSQNTANAENTANTAAPVPTVVASPHLETLDAGQKHEFGTATTIRPGCYRAGVVEDGYEPEWGGRICV
ncbi:hypothetical protein MTQ01_11780 [Streptomyces sp. XM4193]|uniref:hypothetical protein n=1 Tax=Streptomyces sp. XM4193 TaxID=2929782 RepID=UPI001FF9A74D|nr:hypothetical protein [Streptomyces sp. XM4193]MCK1796683.1 hypothetical protein [Streptomyces sp. XM4193]